MSDTYLLDSVLPAEEPSSIPLGARPRGAKGARAATHAGGRTQRSGLELVLKLCAGALGLLLLAELLWFTCWIPSKPMTDVRVESFDGLSRSMVLKAADLEGGSSFFSFDAARAQRSLEAIPAVAKATVTKRFPDGASIVLFPRKPLGVALADVDGRTVPVVFDVEGVVFSIAPKGGVALSGPILSGLRFEHPREGMRLPNSLIPLLKSINDLRSGNPALLDALSEIRVVPRAYEGYELVVYPASRPVRVKIGSELNEEVLRYMMLLLDVLASREIETDELDFRTGTATYRAKEG